MEFTYYSPEQKDHMAKELYSLGKIHNVERQWKRKDGRMIHVLVSATYHKEPHNLIYVSAQDIGERKRAEESLKSSNRELETFIYRASHDIRGPLASIIGLVNVSRLELKDDVAVKYLDMIDSAANKLDYTLSELVKAMKIKDVKLFTDEIDFKTLIKDTLSKYEHYYGFSRLNISIQVRQKGKFISNRSVIETVMQNLIENSIKYQNTIISKPILDIDVLGKENEIKIVVRDNGIGIDQSMQSQVFDMYFRGTDSAKGTGLGLYLVKKGVEKLRGDIQLQSELNAGTAFTIYLPNNRNQTLT
jgi:signal transduction histidine kinase